MAGKAHGSGNGTAKRKKRGGWGQGLFIAAMVLLVLAESAACAWKLGWIGKTTGTDADSSQELTADQSLYTEDGILKASIRLSADRTDFYLNEAGQAVVTVSVPSSIASGSVTVNDADTGKQWSLDTAAMEQNGDECTGTFTMDVTAEKSGVSELTATMGDYYSTPLAIYVTPHITEEQMGTLIDTGADLTAYIQDNAASYADADAEAKAACDWLTKDSRVSGARQDGTSVFYNTTDGLLGEFSSEGIDSSTFGNGIAKNTANASTETTTGTTKKLAGADDNTAETMNSAVSALTQQAKEAAENGVQDAGEYLKKQEEADANNQSFHTYGREISLFEKYGTDKEMVDSGHVMGNIYGGNICCNSDVLGLMPTADSMDDKDWIKNEVQKLSGETGGKGTYEEGDQALTSLLINDDLLQYGTVIWNMHGGTWSDKTGKESTQGTVVNYLAYSVSADKANDKVEKVKEMRNKIMKLADEAYQWDTKDNKHKDEFYNNFYANYNYPNSWKLVYTTYSGTENDGGDVDIYMTSRYLMDRLQGKTFPNTVFYLCSCWGLMDRTFDEWLLNSGAGEVYSYDSPIETGIAIQFGDKIFTGLSERSGTDTLWRTKTVSEAAQYFDENDLNEMLEDMARRGQKTNMSKEKDEAKKEKLWKDWLKKNRDRFHFRGIRPMSVQPWNIVQKNPDGNSETDDGIFDYTLYYAGRGDYFYQGEGTLTGTVKAKKEGEEDTAAVAAGGAVVTAYRYYNMAFQKEAEQTAGSDGSFSFEKLPCGIYVMQVSYNSTDGSAAQKNVAVQFRQEKADGGTIVLEISDKPQNNGGSFVGYKGSLYYWKYTADSFDDPGYDGTFNNKWDYTGNSLICRAADGTEKTLIKDSGHGSLWICGDRIYYESTDQEKSVKLDGSDQKGYGQGSLQYVDYDSGTVLYSGSDPTSIFTISGDQQITLAECEDGVYPEAVAVKDGWFYYIEPRLDDQYVVFVKKTKLDGTDNTTIGTILTKITKNVSGGAAAKGVMSGDDIYVTWCPIGGSGVFYSAGAIYKVSMTDGQVDVVASMNQAEAPIFTGIYQANAADGKSYIYYCGENGDKQYTAFQFGTWPWIEGGVRRVEAASKTAEDTDEVFIPDGSFAYLNGGISTRLNGAAEATEIVTKDMLTAAGYGKLLDFDAKEISTITDFSVVGEKAYIGITTMKLSGTQGQWGMHTAYDREKTTVYEVKIGGTEMKAIMEY